MKTAPRFAAASAILVALALQPGLRAQAPAEGDPWARLPAILANIRPPTFPARDFVVTRYGARGDGRRDCTAAFRAAIAACHRAGGGRVVVPAGEFLTGPIQLQEQRRPARVGRGRHASLQPRPRRVPADRC